MPWLSLIGKLHPRIVLEGLLVLLSGFLLWYNSHLDEKVSLLSLQALSQQEALQASKGRADQASKALQAALDANKALAASEKRLRSALRACQGERVRKDVKTAVEACRGLQEDIHAHLYK